MAGARYCLPCWHLCLLEIIGRTYLVSLSHTLSQRRSHQALRSKKLGNSYFVAFGPKAGSDSLEQGQQDNHSHGPARVLPSVPQSQLTLKTANHAIQQRCLLQHLRLQQELHPLQEPQPPQRRHYSLTHRKGHIHQGTPGRGKQSKRVRSSAEALVTLSQAVRPITRRKAQTAEAEEEQSRLAEAEEEAELEPAETAAVYRQGE